MNSNAEIERLASLVEVHPDYRLLRRLQKRERYAKSDGRKLSIGIILDTETTGLESSDKVIELGMLRFEFDARTGEVFGIQESFCSMEDPGIPISAQSSAIHGITAEMVAGKRFDDSAVEALTRDVELVIAHNARFDRPMIEKRYPLFARLNWACSYQDINWRATGFGGSSLEFIAYRYGFFYDAHGAEMDCRALLEILQRKQDPSGAIRPTHLKQLLSTVGRVEERIWALNAPFDKKEVLKERGYRWSNDNPKCWWTSVSREDGRAERRWLLKNVYNAKGANLRVDVIDSTARFSNRLTDSKTRYMSLDEPVIQE